MSETRHLRLVTTSKLKSLNSNPKDLDEFVGQQRLKGYIRELAAGSQVLGAPFPHSLLVGPSGGGKTTLANLFSKEISAQDCVVILASEEITRNDICTELIHRKPGQFLYVDETHALQRPVQELLYQYIDTGTVPQPGELRPDASMNIKAPSGPIIFSTNHPGALRKELRNRLLVLELDDYSDDDLCSLAHQFLGASFDIDQDALNEIVSAAQGSPRAIMKSLRELIVITQGTNILRLSDAQRLFEHKDVGPKGLPKISCEYIKFLATQPDHRARLSVIADRFGLDSRYVRIEVEPVLHRLGYLTVSPHGRVLSQRGKRYFNENCFKAEKEISNEG